MWHLKLKFLVDAIHTILMCCRRSVLPFQYYLSQFSVSMKPNKSGWYFNEQWSVRCPVGRWLGSFKVDVVLATFPNYSWNIFLSIGLWSKTFKVELGISVLVQTVFECSTQVEQMWHFLASQSSVSLHSRTMEDENLFYWLHTLLTFNLKIKLKIEVKSGSRKRGFSIWVCASHKELFCACLRRNDLRLDSYNFLSRCHRLNQLYVECAKRRTLLTDWFHTAQHSI